MKKLAFGLMRLPLLSDDPTDIDKEQLTKMIDEFIGNGFTYFDTAYPYHRGMSEVIFGELVASRYSREKYTITDKMPIYYIKEEEDLPRYFEEQLVRCKVDYFDWYFLHAMNKNHYETSKRTKAFEFLKRMKEEGKIKHIGFSFHDTYDVLDMMLNEHPEVELVQLQINYLDWDDPVIQSRLCYEVALKHGVDLTIMEPLKGGLLANILPEIGDIFKKENPDLSVASWGIRWCASLKNVIAVLSGMSTLEQVKDNVSYMKDFETLNNHELEVVDKVAEKLKDAVAIKCTRCNYCVDGCPQNIAIPRYFRLYNIKKSFVTNNNIQNEYNDLTTNFGKPDDCIECGQCESKCPQKLNIIKYLKDVKELFK